MANAGAATFDGTLDYLSRGADLTGSANSKSGTVMVFFNRGTTGIAERIIEADGLKFRVFMSSGNLLRVSGENAAGTVILQMDAATALTDTTDWHVLLASWDLATATGHFYIDDADDDDGSPTLTDDTIDYTANDWGIAASDGGSAKFTGCLGPIWFAQGFSLDLSVAANRRLFHTADAVPKLASALNDDSTSPGATPIIWLNNGFATYETNLGSGGGFTENGTLADCTGPEIEAGAAAAFSPALFDEAEQRSTLLRM